MRRVFLCDTLPSPPPEAESEQLHSDDPNEEIAFRIDPSRSCSACHRRMDGIGLGLEMLDVVGQLRTSYDGGWPIEGNGFLEGIEPPDFHGPLALGEKLRGADGLSRCFARHTFEWSFGRDHEAADACTIDALGAAFDAGGHRFRELVLELVSSVAFRFRVL